MKQLPKIPTPWKWYLGIVGIIAVSVVVTLALVEFSPERMYADPIDGLLSWGVSYTTPTSLTGLLTRVVTGPVLVLMICGGIALLITAQSDKISANYPQSSETAVRRRWAFLNVVQQSLGWFSFFLAGILAVATIRSNLTGFVSGLEKATFLVVLMGLAWSFVRSIRRGQIEIDRFLPVEESNSEMKWGLVYYNPSDNRTFVELDDGRVTVVNLARPAAWGVLLTLIIPSVFIVYLFIALS